jgi:hypothetical protein
MSKMLRIHRTAQWGELVQHPYTNGRDNCHLRKWGMGQVTKFVVVRSSFTCFLIALTFINKEML